mgnify:CR=1 FL=1
MQNDFKDLIEKYKADLMQYYAANVRFFFHVAKFCYAAGIFYVIEFCYVAGIFGYKSEKRDRNQEVKCV